MAGEIPPGRTPMMVRCTKCAFEWPVAYLPMEMTKAAQLMTAARCPMCADGNPVMAGSVG